MPIFIGPQSSSNPRSTTPGLAYRQPLLNGEQGTAQTIALMRQLVDNALADPQFVRLAIDLVRSVPAYNDLAEAERLYDWVKSHIRFTKDPVSKEKLYPPQELLKIRAGDCDDISMLLGALLLAVGYPARLVTVSANKSSPNEFSHVYVEAEVPPGSGQWVPMDAARIDSQFGFEPPSYFRKRAWSLTDDSYQDLANGRLKGSLSGIASVPGLGQDSSDWMNILSQTLQEVPAIMSTAAGGGSSTTTSQGTTSTLPGGAYNPYGSFATPYTPGYGVPPAGYTGGIQFGTSGSPWPWIIGGAILLLLMGRR